MSLLKSSVILAFSTVLLLGCKPSKTGNSAKAINTDSIHVLTSNGPYQPALTRKIDIIHTKLELSFNWEKQHVLGIATLTLRPYFYATDTVLLDAKGFDIDYIKNTTKGKRVDAVYKYDSQKIAILLDKQYSAKDTLTFEIGYTAKPNEQPVHGSKAINSDKGLYFINPEGKEKYKPKQIWTQGETEANSKWFPTVDATNERCTQEMYITVDTVFTVLSNGEFVYSIDNGNGTKTDYWKMDLPHAPYLFMMAIGEYTVVKDKLNDMEVNYYVEPSYAPYAKAVFGNTPEMISFFSTKLNYPFPWNKYSQVVVRDFVSGAMENTTATVFMEDVQIDNRAVLDKNWDYIVAHELFHHWFGDLVTCESWANLPLNESFANYSEYLWIEHKYGKDEAMLHAENEQAEYMDEAESKQEPLIRFHYTEREDMFDRHSYNKGGRVLHMLRKQVGDEAFFKSLELYLKTNQFSPVEIHDLRLAFEKVTGEDLNWFFNQWFLSPGHPQLQVSHSYADGKLKLVINQTQKTPSLEVYKLPLVVELAVDGKIERHKVVCTNAKSQFTIPLTAKPQMVVIDPDFDVLCTIIHKKTQEELVNQFNKGITYRTKKDAIEQLVRSSKTNGEDLQLNEVINAALGDSFWAIRNVGLDILADNQFLNFAPFEKTVQNLALNDPKSDVRATAMAVLFKYFKAAKVEVYKKGLADSSYQVLAASLSAYLSTGDKTYPINWVELEKINNLDVMLTLGGYYLGTGQNSKIAWVQEKLERNMGNPRALYNLLFIYGEFLTAATAEEKASAKVLLQRVIDTSKYQQIKSVAQNYLEKLK